ncbi:MAG: serine hydrolase, partial [Bacteroidota bacterium]
PGISIAIVYRDTLLLAKGYGARSIESNKLVDEKTLFSIGSNTKAFTATALGILVEEGKLQWDDLVIKYLPWFRLSDPYVTSNITIRDLLVHRSGLGLGAGDLLWWPKSSYTRKEIISRLQYIPLKTSFRSAYAYDNVLYLVAGAVIEAVSNEPWEDFITNHILSKIGMKNSNAYLSSITKEENVALPHAKINGALKKINPYDADNINPAGGINSCAADMAKLLLCQLDSGKIANSSKLFLPNTTKELWQIITPIPLVESPKELSYRKGNFLGYALGFSVRDYRGKKLIIHYGGLPGYISEVSMIPEIKLGVAVLTNQETYACDAVTDYILDYFLNAQQVDYINAYKSYVARIDSENNNDVLESSLKRNNESHPSLALEKYEGVYSDAWYGDIEIKLKAGRLVIYFSCTPLLTGVLEHFQYDTFIVRWTDPELRADAYITFALNPDGNIDQVKMKAVSPATDFSYDFHDLLLKPKTTYIK